MVPYHLEESRRVEMRGRQFVLSGPVLYRQADLPRSFVIQHYAECEGEDPVGHTNVVTRNRAKYGTWVILIHSVYLL